MICIKRFHRAAVSFFFLAVALLFYTPSAFAEMEPSRFAQWMKVAMTASDILVQSTLPVVAPIEDFLVDPFNITEGIYTDINYLYPRANLETPSMTLESYLQRSSIQVRGDTITIDGVDYQDIWVTHDAAQAFRTNVLDLQTAFNIASNSSGDFVSGIGTFDGCPFFRIGSSQFRTQNYTFGSDGAFGLGNFRVYNGSGTQIIRPGSNFGWAFSTSSGLQSAGGYPQTYISSGFLSSSSTSAGFPTAFQFEYYLSDGSYRSRSFGSESRSLIISDPFDFTWVSQTIPAAQLNPDDGIHLLVPNNPEQHSDPVVQQKIRNFNTDLSTNFNFDSVIDLGIGNNYSLFDSLFDIALGLDIKPSFGPYNSSPPTPTPSPTSEPVPWPTLEPTPVPSASPSPDPTPEPSSSPTPYPTPSSDVPLSDVHWGGFSDFVDNLESSFFKAVVDAITDPFESLWNVIKNATGIWRYVVLWVGNISAPLNWSLRSLGSAGSYFLSPFAAIAAAAVVIAVYRRIGK